MQEIAVKTHLIVTDIHEEYTIKWCGKIADTDPKLEGGLPIFVLIGSEGRAELNTIDMKQIENCAKAMTRPRGRAAVTTDKTFIYIKEKNDNEVLVGIVVHNHVKHYAQMYDKVGYR